MDRTTYTNSGRHIPEVLYYRRDQASYDASSELNSDPAILAGARAVEDYIREKALVRKGSG